jgi:DNA-binding NtrC family response regulator
MLGAARADALVAVANASAPAAIEGFRQLRRHASYIPTVAVLPSGGAETLVAEAFAAADDCVFTPVRMPELRYRLERVLDRSRAQQEIVQDNLLQELGLAQLVGRDPAFLDSVRQVPRLARCNAPVLISGETGTGKELCARAIHFLSNRRSGPFVAVDCAALPDHLLENELFGHSRGAYTDAHRDQRGLVAMAEGGTLFLDEIDSLSMTAQGKLLRFLQDKTFRPLGADRFEQADVQVLAATNKNLDVAVESSQFRADLFYRLNVLRLQLPPLRQRRADIPVLAAHFLREHQTASDGRARIFSAGALRMLGFHHWPGNVRELANVVHRAVVTCEGAQILPCHITLSGLTDSSAPMPAQFRTARAAVLAAFERRYVEDLLRKHGGNVTHAARDANKERRAFGRLIKKHGIDRHVAAQGEPE